MSPRRTKQEASMKQQAELYMNTLVLRSRIFLPRRWRRYDPPKRRFSRPHLHGATPQKTAFRISSVPLSFLQFMQMPRDIGSHVRPSTCFQVISSSHPVCRHVGGCGVGEINFTHGGGGICGYFELLTTNRAASWNSSAVQNISNMIRTERK
jgi:hypothetical protein